MGQVKTGVFARRFVGFLAFLLCGVGGHALAQEPERAEKTLSNGLKVVVQVDNRAPVVVAQLWYRVGSVDEELGRTGLSHALEHMMFKGTKAVPSGEFSRKIAAVGGQENAFTYRDYTMYYELVAKQHLPLVFKLEADRMRNLQFNQDDFEKEMQVIQEERRMRTDDAAAGVLHEQLMATQYIAHPYRNPIIGWMDDIVNYQKADLMAWYQRWYHPNNAVLVVVGDVQPQAVFDLAQQAFGKIPKGPVIARREWKEPEIKGARFVKAKAPADLPFFMLSYPAPQLRNPKTQQEVYALWVLADVLAGKTGRLQNSLVQTGLASSVGGDYDPLVRGPSSFNLYCYNTGKGYPQAELDIVEQEIAAIVKDGITLTELERTKTAVLAHRIYQQDEITSVAQGLGIYEMLGLGWQSESAIYQGLSQVTAEQVQAAAKKYLLADKRTMALLEPQTLEAATETISQEGGASHVQ